MRILFFLEKLLADAAVPIGIGHSSAITPA